MYQESTPSYPTGVSPVQPVMVPQPQEMPHSGLGIASFAITLFAGVFMVMAIVLAGVMEATTPGGIDEESPATVIVGLSIMLLMLLQVVAFGLGIAGAFQKFRKKLFVILGIIFSGMAVIGTIGLIAIGIAFA